MPADTRGRSRLVEALVLTARDSGLNADDCVAALHLAAEVMKTRTIAERPPRNRIVAGDLTPREAEMLVRIINIGTIIREQGGP